MIKKFIALLFVCYASDVTAAELTVSGNWKINFKPDLAYINVNITSKATDQAASSLDNEVAIHALLDSLKSVGIPSTHVESLRFHTFASSYEGNRIKGFATAQEIRVGIYDIGKLPVVLDTLQKVAASLRENKVQSIISIEGISYSSSELKKSYHDALANAVLDSHEKAKVIAKSLGKKLGQPISISDVMADSNDMRLMANMPRKNLAVEATVVIKWDLVD